MSVETCFFCDEETGRAGAGDDSIFGELTEKLMTFDVGDAVGPCCLSCWSALVQLGLVDTE